jgi:hypothetical protein
MSTRVRSLAVVFVILVLLCLTVGPASAGNKTHFTGSEISVETVSPGEEFFPDGRYHVRGAVEHFAFQADDSRLDDADNIVVVNWNFVWMPEPVFVSGPMWGTFELTNEGGSWEGSWTGLRDENGFSYYHFVGHGVGGYDGLQLRMWGERLDPNPSVPEIDHGYILETGG